MKSRKSVLCIAPLPPPITGAALASENIIEYVKEKHDVEVIEYQRGTLQSGSFSISQVFRILFCCAQLFYLRLFKQFDRVYLVISSSMWGNFRDLCFLILMGRRLREKLVVHLHGANFDVLMEKSHVLIKWLNKQLYKDIKAAIILGNTFETIFDGYIDRDKIKIVINYFDPDLLISVDKAAAKFDSSEKIKILYLSNLMKEKGYKILLDVFLKLPEQMKEKVELHYAGTIKEDEKKLFLDMIQNISNIYYHGCVVGMKKRDLFWSSQIFCLPTIFKFEGQPISILEAYASGCCVLTTRNGGIKDIFNSPENGITLDQDPVICANDLKKSLEDLILNIEAYRSIGLHNRTTARDIYHKDKFTDSITSILLN